MDAHGEVTLGTASRGLAGVLPVMLSASDRRRHLHVIGKTGTGKTTLLYNMILADLEEGRGCAVLDPHGDLARAVIDAVPPERTNDVLYLDPSDIAFPVGLNPLDGVPPDRRPLVAAQIVAAFKHLFAESWGPRLEYVLLNSLRLILDSARPSLVVLPRLLVDEVFRDGLIATCRDPLIRLFWTKEFAEYSERFAAEVMMPLQNKAGAFLAVPFLRNILGQKRATVDLPRLMNERRVLIANLAKGNLGDAPTHLLGAFLVTAFAQAAEARASMDEDERRDFYLYCDEFQNFATESFAAILSEARKWRLSLTLAHQYFGQLPPRLKQAVLANAGSLIAFRTGAEDAEELAAEFAFESRAAFTDLANFTAWAKLMRNGIPADPVALETAFTTPRYRNRSAAVVARTRARHTRPRALVERHIAETLGLA